jgi:hypothetical protein
MATSRLSGIHAEDYETGPTYPEAARRCIQESADSAPGRGDIELDVMHWAGYEGAVQSTYVERAVPPPVDGVDLFLMGKCDRHAPLQ